MTCGAVNPNTARFVTRDVYDKHVMNHKWTNQTGYRGSDMRMHVLNDILPLFPQEWQDIMKPRQIKEKIQGKTVEYGDKLWILSATDVFGQDQRNPPWWIDIDTSYQLSIFEDKQNRIFTFKGKPCMVWLRSVRYNSSHFFCAIDTDGTAGSINANRSWGLPAGFDI